MSKLIIKFVLLVGVIVINFKVKDFMEKNNIRITNPVTKVLLLIAIMYFDYLMFRMIFR